MNSAVFGGIKRRTATHGTGGIALPFVRSLAIEMVCAIA